MDEEQIELTKKEIELQKELIEVKKKEAEVLYRSLKRIEDILEDKEAKRIKKMFFFEDILIYILCMAVGMLLWAIITWR
jgi:hypothetical protein